MIFFPTNPIPLPHLLFFPKASILKWRKYWFPFPFYSTLYSSPQPYFLPLFTTWSSSQTDLINWVGNFIHPCIWKSEGQMNKARFVSYIFLMAKNVQKLNLFLWRLPIKIITSNDLRKNIADDFLFLPSLVFLCFFL